MKLITQLAILSLWSVTFASAESVTLAWDANPEAEKITYRLHYGNAPGTYQHVIDVPSGITATTPDLSAGTWYFAVQAVGSTGLVSPFSDEVSKTIHPPAPAAPTGMRFVIVETSTDNTAWDLDFVRPLDPSKAPAKFIRNRIVTFEELAVLVR